MAERREPEAGVDRRLRGVLDAPPGAAERIARNALAAPERPLRLWLVPAAAAAILAATILVLLVAVPGLDRTPRAGVDAERPVSGVRYAITNRDGIVVVRSLNGGLSSLHAGGRRAPSPAGMMIIVLGEETP